ncbi:MAG TPA: hypothetical protein VFB66_26145 [Tepidisphaeraceae bacterium]|nr:hypothetical protein [Tepidisphaeraceae bacterium]
MLRRVLAVTALTSVIAFSGGCGGGARPRRAVQKDPSQIDPPAQAMTDTQLAAHAGNAEFPTARPRDDRRIAAIVARDRRVLKLYNFENTPLSTTNVWVNGAYVQPLRAVPANSKTPIQTSKLFNKQGHRFSERSEEINRVQLETPDGLYNVMGPATE